MNADQLRKRFPNASASFLQANADGVCAADPQSVKGQPLERVIPREKKSSGSSDVGIAQNARARIIFRVFSVRPADWDGYHIKEVQDLLCHAGVLAGDAWDLLEGRIVTGKVHTKSEERTEITIEQVT